MRGSGVGRKKCGMNEIWAGSDHQRTIVVHDGYHSVTESETKRAYG